MLIAVRCQDAPRNVNPISTRLLGGSTFDEARGPGHPAAPFVDRGERHFHTLRVALLRAGQEVLELRRLRHRGNPQLP